MARFMQPQGHRCGRHHVLRLMRKMVQVARGPGEAAKAPGTVPI